MPKDKIKSHQKIIEVAKRNFLENGFENVSMRDIAKEVGMVQAGLYKHFESKEAMFNALVDPFVEMIMNRSNIHKQNAYQNYDNTKNVEMMVSDNVVVMMKDFMKENHDELRLIVCCSHGTKYESFFDEMIWLETKETYQALMYLKEHGAKVKDISEDELHVIMTSYMSAVLEPIKHDWPLDKSIECLNKIEEFFIPAWKLLMGF